MQTFLADAGWDNATLTPLTPDWSPRQYTRLKRANGQTAIFLQGPAQDYPGHGLRELVEVGSLFKQLGLNVPDIYAQDLSQARLLLEDFGDKPIDAPDIESEAYEVAVDVLKALRADPAMAASLTLYEDGYIFKKLPLFAINYAKADVEGWNYAWQSLLATLPACPHVMSHMDYKAGNLHWLPDRSGLNRIGILDYQAAQNAPFVYDIVNLLEDARRNIAPQLKAHLKQRFRDALPEDWKALFDAWYPVMAAQFHARVLGQLSAIPNVAPDVVPRLEAYLREELRHPALRPVYDWCWSHGILT